MPANDTQVGGSHYKIGGEEHWDRVWRLYGRGYFVGCITKYVERYPYKAGVDDLEKAAHFLRKLIELEKGSVPPGQHYREQKWPLQQLTSVRDDGAEPGPGYINQDPDIGHPPR